MKNRTQYLKWGLTAFLTVCAVLVFTTHFIWAVHCSSS